MKVDEIGRRPSGPSRGMFFLRSAAAFALSAFLVLALSFAIVWPLWSLATHDRRAYTVAAALAAALALARGIVRARARAGARSSARRRSSRARRPAA